MTPGQESLPLFPSERAFELLMPLLNGPKIPDNRSQVTALLLRICSVLESCSTVSRLDIHDRVETTLKSYSVLQAPDVSHAQYAYFGSAKSMDLACVLAGLVHQSSVGAVNPPLPRKAPGEAAVANLRRKLDAYLAWKETKEVMPPPRSTHPRSSSVAGISKPSPNTANTQQRPHPAYGYNKAQRHSSVTLTSPNPRIEFAYPKRSPPRRLNCSPHLSTIKEPENDHPNGNSGSFPEWSPYRPPDAKTADIMMRRTIFRRENDPLTASQINSFTARLPACVYWSFCAAPS